MHVPDAYWKSGCKRKFMLGYLYAHAFSTRLGVGKRGVDNHIIDEQVTYRFFKDAVGHR